MSSLPVILIAGAVSALTMALAVALLLYAFGQVYGDRASCLAAHPGATCGLVWEPL